jgi:hypothetical protein
MYIYILYMYISIEGDITQDINNYNKQYNLLG